MKLSEAILAGCKKRPKQAFYDFYSAADRSCVIGAAFDGVGKAPQFFQIRETFTDVPKSALFCPDESCAVACYARETSDLPDLCMHLNDVHKWTRERIAEFVAMIERTEPHA